MIPFADLAIHFEFYFGNEVGRVRAVSTQDDTFGALIARLQESHAVSVYGAIERFVQAGQAVGLDVDDLIRLLDQGKTLQELFELVEARMEARQAA